MVHYKQNRSQKFVIYKSWKSFNGYASVWDGFAVESGLEPSMYITFAISRGPSHGHWLSIQFVFIVVIKTRQKYLKDSVTQIFFNRSVPIKYFSAVFGRYKFLRFDTVLKSRWWIVQPNLWNKFTPKFLKILWLCRSATLSRPSLWRYATKIWRSSMQRTNICNTIRYSLFEKTIAKTML